MAADLNSSDEEILSPRRRRLSSGNKRQRFSDSGDDSSGNNCDKNKHVPTTSGRRSDRIKRRQSREFRLPDKHAYREQIQHTDGIVKSVSPKKRVNNLTKVNNRYNADTYDTDEEDLSDFIVYDDEVEDDDESSEESDTEKRKPKGIVDRNRTEFSASKRQRLRDISSSDSETEIRKTDTTANENGDSPLCSGVLDNGDKNVNESKKADNQNNNRSSSNVGINRSDNSGTETNKETNLTSRDSEEEEDSDSVPHTGSSNKKRQIMSSDSDSDESSESERETATSRIENRRLYRQELFKELKDSRRKSK